MEEGCVCEKEGHRKIIEYDTWGVDSTFPPDKPRKMTQWLPASAHEPDPSFLCGLWPSPDLFLGKYWIGSPHGYSRMVIALA